MKLHLLKSKIHNARVTSGDLEYEGSITIDQELLLLAEMIPNEKVLVVNNNNGERFETYIINGEPGSRVIQLNGAAARCALPGDEIIIMTFAVMDEKKARTFQPMVLIVDHLNNPKRRHRIGQEDEQLSSSI
ncbi:aspartate 1-decarboxylase [Chlorobium phaeobacteroides]|jgi:aspartate 1-decarboxylase|uniref:Aspartate 1-decarboxylase n=1 Tax=Chlorobium phaeobacteroides (strain DSM 266 / SMG 266 / 2430) TaxID=290317 RepID=PAND_CHLPD|nr:aspartate 1-decarboxylase [Chlorobium phaeobacteroides]A1BDG1.1 RecName: Full=Aspartate 1-decarboxylase; AltName: Full=Aspartate alpha-decarboxylase; Contains: RecName: Full=Aspartate 1-decarboxylase beta chain; Contains: RecName: Full=Aspartate 1-decarboxylase alpha chain; Flags: Precursor [Chlorobium phaeobacteroides DSM 266]ABL64438.1 aspartate 1-decarboxylase [Chlorobium phaeobacteroides DSM 266]MBV5319795.1 aspartate 1-decarboxylase [Chlorobium phaeobacteroides]